MPNEQMIFKTKILSSKEFEKAKELNAHEILMMVGYGAKEEKVLFIVECLHSIGHTLKDFFKHFKDEIGYVEYHELKNLEVSCSLYSYLYKKLTDLSKDFRYKLDFNAFINNFEEYTDSILKLPLKLDKKGNFIFVKETKSKIIPDNKNKSILKEKIFNLIENINKVNKIGA